VVGIGSWNTYNMHHLTIKFAVNSKCLLRQYVYKAITLTLGFAVNSNLLWFKTNLYITKIRRHRCGYQIHSGFKWFNNPAYIHQTYKSLIGGSSQVIPRRLWKAKSFYRFQTVKPHMFKYPINERSSKPDVASLRLES